MTLNALILPTPDAMLQSVAETPAAIGYVSFMHLSSAVKALAVEGVQPTWETVEIALQSLTPWLGRLFVEAEHPIRR